MLNEGHSRTLVWNSNMNDPNKCQISVSIKELPLWFHFIPHSKFGLSLNWGTLLCPFLQEAFLCTLGWVGHFLWVHTFPLFSPWRPWPLGLSVLAWSLWHPLDRAELSLSGDCLSTQLPPPLPAASPFFRELVRAGTEPSWSPLCSQPCLPQNWEKIQYVHQILNA